MKKLWIVPVVAALVLWAIGAQVVCPPNLTSWTRCDYFRCRECSGPALIDPDQPERWGCRACGYATFRIGEKFRVGAWEDFGGHATRDRAMKQAGIFTHGDPHQRTPTSIWTEAGGSP